MYNVERKAGIIALLEEQGEVEVNSLSEKFGKSKETIRRDLGELEKDGVLVRTHGGALYNGKKSQKYPAEYPVAIRGIQRYKEKNMICKRAASLLKDGDTIFIDNSSTSMYLIKYIPKKLHITVITNSLKVLLESLQHPNTLVDFICFGGHFRNNNLSFYGNTTLKNAAEFFPSKSFISCTGISEKGVLTDGSMQEAEAKRLMITQSQTVCLLADYSKFATTGPVYLADLQAGSIVVTDEKVTAEHQELVKKLRAELILA